jgi:membrane protease subunit HflC
MKAIHRLVVIVVVVLLLLVLSSLFVVRQGQDSFIQQLGKIGVNAEGKAKIYGPGLHFKWPLVNKAKIFDTRLNGFSSGQFSVITTKQTFLEVEYYVKWRIKDLALYYKRTGGMPDRAITLMEPKINDIVRAQFGKKTSNQIISTQRNKIMAEVLGTAEKQILQEYGIEVIDVRLQSAKLPSRVLKSVFNRMASERKQFANNKRAEGQKASESIKAKADQKVIVIKAKANKEAALLRAEGDQKAAENYAKAYKQNPDFYAFYRSLKAYQETFNEKDDIVVLSPNSQFFDYFNQLDKKQGK